MAKKKNINKINYCEYHIYFPIKFETTLSYNDICETIANSNAVLSAAQTQQLYEVLAHDHEDLADQLKRNPELECFTISSLNPPEGERPSIELLDDDLYFELTPTDKGFAAGIRSYEIDYHEQLYYQSNNEFEVSSTIYGDNFTKSQDRFLLLPLRITLCNDIDVWLTVRLFVFSNKYGILKFELPLLDISPEPLMEHAVEKYVQSISNRWNIPNVTEDVSFTSLHQVYFNLLCERTHINLSSYSNRLHHIMMIDYEDMPKSISKIDSDIAYDLYSIICAPISPYHKEYYEDRAKEYIKTNHWTSGNIKYILKTTGGCLSTLDSTTLKNYAVGMDFNLEDPDTDSAQKLLFYNSIADTIRVGSEFALTVLILKKTLMTASYHLKENLPEDLLKIRKHYNESVRYLCKIQEECFGSASEQIEVFEQCMPYYFKTELTEKKMKAIDDILDQQENQRRLKFNDFIAIGGIIIASILGLPAIHETLTIINDMFIKSNIPFISVNNLSFIFWISLIVIISIIYIKHKRK